MTRYVEHKHGLILGSGNIFFINEPDSLRTYNAIVWAKNITFEYCNMVNVKVRSFANQIIWDEIITDHGVIEGYKLDWWVRNWLDKEVGEFQVDWDIRTNIKQRGDTTIFFKKRSNALKFIRKIEELLTGEQYL